METPQPEHEPKTDLKYLFRNFVSIIMFCVDQAEIEMKENEYKKCSQDSDTQK